MELDEVVVHDVEAAPVPSGGPTGSWRCASCGSSYPVQEGFKVRYDCVPGVPCVAFVCPVCAETAARRTA